ncbi:MAG: hypothetical protein JWN39_611, partial [Ilumatobacteraceae bacterium]|nr:hypothetical protein [Ilumatobacteraceae bacterium]
MTPSIDVSLPTAPTSVRQTTPASASAPVAFQDCLDGVPPADVAKSPSAKGNPDDTSTDEPRKTARPVDDPAALAALAAVSVPTPRTTVDGATALLGRGAAASVAGQTTDVADGSALPQPATALAAVTATTVAAGQVTPALAPSDADAAVGTAAGDSTGALTAATSTSPVASPTAPLAADPGSSGAAVLDLAAPGTGATPAVGASAIEPANST